MTESTADLEAILGKRFVLREEYAGGEGRTLRVAEFGGGPDLVLKVLPRGHAPAEASLLLSLRHPAIPAVRELGQLPDGRAFVLREHVDGRPLRVLPADPDALREPLQQLLEVLAFVHLRGVLHLDLKPANLLQDRFGRLHLLDFGLGVRGGARGRGGTPFFAAPELLLGGIPDARADLFSVGAMVAQALWPGSGPPLGRFVNTFPGEDFFTAGNLRREQLPPPFNRFVERCVARRPSRRFADAQAALEFVCGGSGRPSTALLAPDPVELYAPELASAAAAGERDLVLVGASAADRRALAMHLAASSPGVQELIERTDELRVVRSGGAAERLELRHLDGQRLMVHLQSCLGLQGAPATAAAEWLARRAGASAAAVQAQLLALVHAGELVPSGTRWTWPAARSGRLGSSAAPDVATPVPNAAHVRAAAASGRHEAAIAMWQTAATAGAADEPELREALAEGLLDGGEPARALPFCAGLPVVRAQALFDTGQFAAASRELGAVTGTMTARQRRVAAQLAQATGQHDLAVQLLQQGSMTVLERVTLAAMYEQSGRLDESESLLEQCAEQLAPEREPFVCASVQTALGHVQRQRGQLGAAQRHFQAASDLLFGIGNVRHAAGAQLNLGVIAKDLGEHALAVERLREARTMFLHIGDRGLAARAAASLGIVALAGGDAAAARPWLQESSAVLLELGDVSSGRVAQAMLARAHAELGDHAAAATVLEQIGAPESDRVREEVAQVQTLLHAAAETSDPPDPPEPMPDRPAAAAGPSRELFRTFLAVNRQLAQETDLDKALRHLLDAAVTLSGGRIGYLLVARNDGMRREFQSGDTGPSGQAFSRSLAHRAMHLQRTLTGADGLADRDLQDAPSIRNLQVRSAICAPFRSAGGTIGAIYVEHAGRAGAFAETDKEALEVLADQAAIAVDRMLREEALAKELSASRRELAVVKRSSRREPTQLLGDSKPMRDLRLQIDKLASLELPVLVLGETGSGKELVARALHERSARHRGPFVAENCSALPAELMERELFGHVQGAFTGADRDGTGLLELASGGTLFLDEVGDMPPALQAKLLRALQEQSIRRVGGTDSVQLDLRVLAATHKDLRAMVQRGEFREDLFFRLAAVELRLPPLRERGDDIVALAEHFLKRHGAERGRALRFSPACRAALLGYAWPGNVRELDHIVARAALLSDTDEIVDLQLPKSLLAPVPASASAVFEIVTLKEAERRAIVQALQTCGGDKAKTARALSISRTALYEKIKRHGLNS